MGGQDGTVDGALARIAARSHGVVSRADLLIAGVSGRQIDRRLARGTLLRVHRGVYRVEPEHVEAVLARRPNAPGARALRRVIHGDEPVTLSRLESRFLERLRNAGLPLPATNRPAGGRRVDCRWPEHRLTVELDSYRCHRSRYAWDQDRERERAARARGDEFRRYTWVDADEKSRPMLRDLARLLAVT